MIDEYVSSNYHDTFMCHDHSLNNIDLELNNYQYKHFYF